MPDEILTQPQTETIASDEAMAGVISPQPEAEAAVAEAPGAEIAKPERTYTQKEWSARESAKDKEIAQHQQALAYLHQQHQFQLAQAQEAQALAADRRAVEEGTLTDGELAQRSQQRRVANQQLQAWLGAQAQFQQAQAETNEKLRLLAAREMADEYGVDIQELVKDKTLTTPARMEEKAISLRLEKRKAELKAGGDGETFASGQMGTAGIPLDKMSPEEMILHGLAHPPRKTK